MKKQGFKSKLAGSKNWILNGDPEKLEIHTQGRWRRSREFYRTGKMAVEVKGKACAKVLRLARGLKELEGGQGEGGNKGALLRRQVIARLWKALQALETVLNF